MKRILLSTFTMLIFFTSVTFGTLPTILKPEDTDGQEPRTFRASQEMVAYANDLFDLCTQGEYEKAHRQAFPDPLIDIKDLSLQDIEAYTYLRNFSLGEIYLHKAEQEVLNTAQAIEYNQRAAAYLQAYLTEFGNVVSKISTTNDQMHHHRALIYLRCGKAFSNWGGLLPQIILEGDDATHLRNIVVQSSQYYEKALFYIEMSPKLKKSVNLLKVKYNLFDKYCILINIGDEGIRKTYLPKANAIHQEFKNDKNAQSYVSETEQVLILLQMSQAKAKLEQTYKGSKKRKKLIEDKVNMLGNDIAKEFKVLTENDPQEEPLQSQIIEQHGCITLLAKDTLSDPNIQTQLKAIEQNIQSQLILANVPATLLDVYQQYEIFLGGEKLRQDILLYILPSFLLSGNVNDALERVNILAELELRKLKHNSNLTRFIRAGIKNMIGDFSEWEALEAEMVAQQAKEKEKKGRKKKKQHEERIEVIKYDQKQHESEKASRSATLQPMRSPEKKVTSFLTEEDHDNEDVAFISNPEEKQEKQRRHKEAEKRREKETLDSSNAITTTTSTTTTTTTTTTTPTTTTTAVTVVPQAPTPLIRDLYPLTGVAKDVDAEIENDTWMVSRDQLISYFKALECIAKNGAKHKKVSLPEALIIQHEGKTLTILNDLGGALTLPHWDGPKGNGTVPDYLRKQILDAREKLVLLKMKENKVKIEASLLNQ